MKTTKNFFTEALKTSRVEYIQKYYIDEINQILKKADTKNKTWERVGYELSVNIKTFGNIDIKISYQSPRGIIKNIHRTFSALE